MKGRWRAEQRAAILCGLLMQAVSIAQANPTGLSSSTPGVGFSGVGTSHATITSSAARSIVNAQGFDIAQGETTSIVQGHNAAMLVRIGGPQTFINGNLNAMGQLFLLNPNGVLFGKNAQVNVGAIIASSLHLSDANFLVGHYLFQGTGAEGWVKNAGAIHTSFGGAYLLAPNVENSGIITSPGGNIVLGAGTTAYLSNRSDGRGFLAEITAPTGQAVNLKDLIADGGRVTMAGRTVNQEGLIQANSIRQQGGKIELLATEAVTLKDGSRTIAKGATGGVSPGGTILAKADLKTGQATVERGALIDVSGGRKGGNGGFAEVSAAAVSLRGQFVGLAANGYKGGRFLIDPETDIGPADFASFEGSGASNVTFQSPAGNDLVVTGQYDLNAGWNLSGTPGTLTFLAGANLIFNNAVLTNNGSNTKWDYVGTAATGDVLFNNSVVTTGFGGNQTFTALQGNIKLIDSIGNLSVLGTSLAGGNITLKAGLDVVVPSTTDTTGSVAGTVQAGILGGIRLDGPGDLAITAGNDVRGGPVLGVLTGPGFVLTNGTATVTAGRNIGGPTSTNPNLKGDEYANLVLQTGTINLTAQTGNIYLGRVADKGVADTDPNFTTMTVDPTNKVVLQAQGDIYLNPRPPVGIDPSLGVMSAIYPASFSATTQTGSIFVQNNLTFFPSTTGSLTLSAGKDLVGVQKPVQITDDQNYGFIFIGFPNVPGGHWQLVNLNDAAKDPTLSPFFSTTRSDVQSINGIPKPPKNQLPTRLVYSTAPSITMLEQDPSLFHFPDGVDGTFILSKLLSPQSSTYYLSRTNNVMPAHNAQPVLIEARTGNIERLLLNLGAQLSLGTGATIPLKKQVSIHAGNDIVGVTARVGVPDGVVATIQADHNLDMRSALTAGAGASSDVTFNGTGTGKVIVGNLMDLATSTGINYRYSPNNPSDLNKPGLLDISVGGSIKMDSSRIATYNGESISIHGIGSSPIVDGSGNVVSANGKPIVVNGTTGPDGTIQVNGQVVEYKNNPVNYNNAQPLTDPSTVTLHLSIAEQNSQLLRDSKGQPYQVLRVQVTLDSNSLTGFDPVLVKGNIVLLGTDGSILLVPVGQVAKMQSLPGVVTVGSNVSSNPTLRGAPLGITTLGGGGIDIFAKSDINVDKSRISTFQGGDINLTSTNGVINAGSGSRNEAVDLSIPQPNDPVTGQKVPPRTVHVPASGISTFSPMDGFPLKFLKFSDPEINALRNEAAKQTFFGRQSVADALLAKANQLQEIRQNEFNKTVLNPYINGLHLGDAFLVAERGSINIPSAGIQCRTCNLFAPSVIFQGGSIVGNAVIPSTVTVSGPPSIVGTGSGAVQTPVTPVSGSTATASAASTTAAVSTSAKSTEAVQESASEASAKQSEAKAKQVAAKNTDENGKSAVAQSVRIKRGVVIQVDVKPQQGS